MYILLRFIIISHKVLGFENKVRNHKVTNMSSRYNTPSGAKVIKDVYSKRKTSL